MMRLTWSRPRCRVRAQPRTRWSWPPRPPWLWRCPWRGSRGGRSGGQEVRIPNSDPSHLLRWNIGGKTSKQKTENIYGISQYCVWIYKISYLIFKTFFLHNVHNAIKILLFPRYFFLFWASRKILCACPQTENCRYRGQRRTVRGPDTETRERHLNTRHLTPHLRASLLQSSQSEYDGSLVLLNNLSREKLKINY